MNRVQTIQIKVWKYKTLECLEIKKVKLVLAVFASFCLC